MISLIIFLKGSIVLNCKLFSSLKIHLTLWGKAAEEFDAGSQPIVALKGVKVSDFGGRTLSTLSSTVMQVGTLLTVFKKSNQVTSAFFFTDKSRLS